MNARLETLKRQGCDVDQALHRVLGDEAFYLALLKTFSGDSSITGLEKAMSEKDYAAAFEASHKLKGSALTLGLTPVAKSVSKVLEDLRTDPPSPSLQSHYRQAKTVLVEYLQLLQET